MRRVPIALLAAALLAGCGSSPDPPRAATPTPTPDRGGHADAAPGDRRARPLRPGRRELRRGDRARGLRRGVDPDGDGDAHYVLAGGDVTAPGVSIIDVGVDLRPERLPRLGDLVSAAGPVYTGSHGQKQIEAVEVHHQRD